MQYFPAAIFRLTVPALLIACGLLLRPRLGALDSDLRVLVDYLPYVICAVAVVVSHLFSQVRLLLASVAVAVLFWQVQTRLQVSLDDAHAALSYVRLTVVMPLASLYLLIIPERGIWSRYGLLSAAGLLLLGGVALLLAPVLPQPELPGLLSFAARPVDGYIMSYGASVLAAVAAVCGLVLLVLRNSDVDAALLGGLTALYLLLAQLHLDEISVVMATAAGLCLVYGLLRSTHDMAYRDDLTGLLGRRALNQRVKGLGSRYAIAMVDVDHFKRFNDKHGHDVGDEVLKLVASRLARVGGGGTAYRYGGEEFCIVFPRKSAADCLDHLDALRKSIAGYEMSLRDRKQRPRQVKEGSRKRGATRIRNENVSVTVSVGVAERAEDTVDADAVIKMADAKLYAAKRAGRNRVVA